MKHKIIYIVPFYHARGAPLLCLLSCYTAGLYSQCGNSCAPYIFPYDIPPFLRLLPYG
jgi:hypothetical protein